MFAALSDSTHICEIIAQWLNKDNNKHTEIEVLLELNRPCILGNCSTAVSPDISGLFRASVIVFGFQYQALPEMQYINHVNDPLWLQTVQQNVFFCLQTTMLHVLILSIQAYAYFPKGNVIGITQWANTKAGINNIICPYFFPYYSLF